MFVDYQSLAELYYKYREIDDIFIENSLQYYLLAINIVDEYKKYSNDQRVAALYRYHSHQGDEYINNELKKLENIETYGADNVFKRAIIILEKLGDYNKALEICDKAICFNENAIYYRKKKEKILRLLK